MDKLLTIGMSTYDDFDGVYFTVQALKMYHDVCDTDKVEFLVLDNNPTGNHAKETEKFITKEVRNGRYVALNENSSSWNKYKVPDYANGEYILILDSHVLLQKNAINVLLDYYQKNPDCKDLIQGPLVYNDLRNRSTHWDKNFRGHMFGTWGTNKEGLEKNEPFEIPMQGMACVSFKKSSWKGINPHFKGFGGEEWYISEKFRMWGGKNICIPSLGWVHRFARPNGVPFRCILEDRIWNYFIGWLEIYKDPEHEMIKNIYDHFKDTIPAGSIDIIFKKAVNEKEKWLNL
jgi:hypothetical protein